MNKKYFLLGFIGKFITTYFVLVSVFLITVIAACTIPSSLLKQNIGKTLNTLKKEGSYPSFGIPWRQIVLDNFTDTLMLNTVYSVDSKNPLKSALVNIRHDGNVDSINQISNLEKLYFNKDIQQVGYERYWHGYLIYLRPLLAIVSYSGIRIFITLLLYSSFIFFIYLSWKKLGKIITIAFILGLISVDFFYLGQSMQFSSVFLIGLLGGIYMILTYKNQHSLYILFFIIGALTSFFDLLTAPLITLGMLLIIATSLEKKNKISIFLYCLLWSIGYLLLWFSKWLIVQILFTPGAIVAAFNQIIDRTVNRADANFSHLNAVKLNFFQLIGYNRVNKIIILFIFIVSSIFFIRYFAFKKEKINKVITWILIGIIPYLWYLIAANHSYLHVWYTYRNQFMSVVCLFLVAVEFIDWSYVRRDLKSIGKNISFYELASKNHKN